jgi:hypothetical protein
LIGLPHSSCCWAGVAGLLLLMVVLVSGVGGGGGSGSSTPCAYLVSKPMCFVVCLDSIIRQQLHGWQLHPNFLSSLLQK